MTSTCDTAFIRTRAEQTLVDYAAEDVRSDHGLVIVLFTGRGRAGNFAVAMRASGTRLTTSVASLDLEAAELERASSPVMQWWQDVTLQAALAVCGQAVSDEYFADLPAALHRAAESAVRTYEDDRRPRPLTTVGDVLVCLLLGGAVVGLWRVRHRVLADARPTLWLVIGIALILRFAAHAGPSDIRLVLEDVGTRRAGWSAILHFIFRLLPWKDETIWTINRIVGALSVALLYGVMRRRFADRIAAVAGATALAVTPLIVRFSATDTPYILQCAALLSAILAYDHFIESASLGALALGLALLTAALQLRPEAPWLIVPAAFVAFAAGLPRRGVTSLVRPSFVLCALGFIAINGIATVWALRDNLNQVNNFVLVGTLFGSPLADPNMTPRVLLGLVTLGAAAALLFEYRWSGLLWLLATTIALPLDFPTTVSGSVAFNGQLIGVPVAQYANARYHIPAMYLACGLVGLGVATVLGLLGSLIKRIVPAAPTIAVGIVCLAALPRLDVLERMWTPQQEFEFFRNGLAQMEPECVVVAMLGGVDSGFVPFTYLRPGRIVDIGAFLAKPSTPDCVVYYRGGNCYTLELAPGVDLHGFPMNPACRAIEQRFELESIAEEQIAARPYRGEVYLRNPLPLGFYRLHAVARGAATN